MNCRSCHHLSKNLIGPPINVIIDRRNSDWIYNFLTNSASRKADSTRRANIKWANGVECLTFNDLTRHDVAQIIDYLTH